MIHLTSSGWLLALLGALLIGLSKTGLSGGGILAVALFAQILPSRASTGIILPLLICADLIAVTAFRRHAVWSHVRRLFPVTALGVLLGALAMHTSYLKDNGSVKHLIGLILTILILWTYFRRWAQSRRGVEPPEPSHGWPTVVGTGLLAGLLTMLANASGPVMTLYLLAVGLPKMEFIGTGAWFFLLLNCFKVPFSAGLGLINRPSLVFDLMLAPVALVGALWGKWLISFLNQKVFEELALVCALLSGLKMLIS